MSSEREEERKEYVERDPSLAPPPAAVPREYVVGEPVALGRAPVAPAVPPANEHREAVVRRRTTNTGAIVAIVVGLLVLLFGIYLVFSQIKYLPAPYSWIAILIVGLILIGIGASLVRTRTTV